MIYFTVFYVGGSCGTLPFTRDDPSASRLLSMMLWPFLLFPGYPRT